MESAVQRSLIAMVQILGLSVWFSASAVVPNLKADWGISDTAAVWLTATVQLGFVVGALVSTVLNLADRIPPHILMGLSAAAAAATTACVAWFVDSMGGMLVLRFLTGAFLAGVYPVGIKLTASWTTSGNRGMAMGLLIGALTVGSALPHLIGGLVDLPWRGAMQVTALVAAAGAVLAGTCVRPGPRMPSGTATLNPRYAVTMFTQRRTRLVNLGYFGHMWELYALWAWIPTFLAHAPAASSDAGGRQVLVFVTMGVFGLLGCLLGGWAADRIGRPRAAVTALAVSGTCCATSVFAYSATPVVLAGFCAIWGASVIADSGVFSTALSESADQRFVGTALSAQTAIGFALTVASIQLVPVLADATSWRYALLLLLPGPVLGAIAMSRLTVPAVTATATA